MFLGDSFANISGNGHRDINIKVNINKKEEESVENKSLNWLPVANCFSGRKDIFEEIKKEFTDKKYVVLYGMPGIGKTETARKFGNHYCDYFNGNLIWIFSETSDNIKECFDKLATSLDLKITDASQIFNKFLKSKALIVFDNAESMAAIKHYLPSNELHPTVRVLITSRFSTWDPFTSISKIHLSSLKTKDALNIFRQKIDKFDEYELKNWEELVRKLDKIPLCLQIVSSLIQQQVHRIRLTKFKLEDFINELEAKLISSTIPDSEQNYYQKSVLVAINSVLSRFEDAKAISSLDLLCFVAYLDADRIYDDVLLLIPSIEKSEQQLEEALNKVVDYSLIQIVKDFFSSKIKIKVHRTVQLVLRDYDVTKRNGDMFKTLLRLTLYDEIDWHHSSIFNYANKKEFLEKTKEFYNENHENESLLQEIIKNFIENNCDEVLQIILPKLMNGRVDKFIEMLFYAIYFGRHLKTILVFFKSVAQNEEDVRQIQILSEWRSTKLIDILLKHNILKYNNILKNDVTGKYLRLLVKKSNKQNIKETIECINHLVSKWGADILYQDDDLNNILHIACRNRQIPIEIIECLFQLKNGKLKGIVDCQNKEKETPLHVLFKWKTNNPDLFEIFRYFITKFQADITIPNEHGRNILFIICVGGSFEMIELILKERDCSEVIFDQDEDGDVAFNELFWNKSIEKTDIIKLIDYILKNKKVLNNSEKRNEIIKKMLCQVILYENNNLEIFKHLIANSSICEKTWPSIELIDTLLQTNFIEYKIWAANKFLHSFVKMSYKENVKETIKCINHLLLNWDADILYRDEYLNNILHVACSNTEISLKILEYLFQLENGKLKGIVDGQNAVEKTPLHYLLYWNSNNPDIFEIFRYFITKLQADITIQDISGDHILFGICRYGSFEMIEFILRERDCSQIINNQGYSGEVVFCDLIRNDSITEADKLKLFNLFLEYKMDINLKNLTNKTLLEIATEKRLYTLTEVIQKCLKELEYKTSKRMKR